MTVEELEINIAITLNVIDDVGIQVDFCKKLSIEFAISVLEEIWDREDFGEDLQSKIQELKQYLDEKI